MTRLAPSSQRRVIFLMKKSPEQLRQIVSVESQHAAVEVNQPLVKGPGIHQLSRARGEFQIHVAGAAFYFSKETSGIWEVLDDMRRENKVTALIGNGESHGIRL